jgi:hypothetical protein
LPTYWDIRWKCFNCGTVNLSSGAGGEDVRGDCAQGGASDDRPVDNGHYVDELLNDQCVSGNNNLETLVCSEHQQETDQELPIAFAVTKRYSGTGVMVTSL